MNLPRVLLNWIDPAAFALQETKATCSDCLRVRQRRFKPSLKCCTYAPFLANFAVGALLKSPQGHVWIAPFLESSNSAPIGIVPEAEYRKKFIALGINEYGQREDLKCPYYDRAQGGCGVWEQRSSACISYFCESSYGDEGEVFWRTYEEFLRQIEIKLIEESLIFSGLCEKEVDRLMSFLPHGPFGRSLPPSSESLWVEFQGDRGQFFIQSYEHVCELSKEEFWHKMGAKLREQNSFLQDEVRRLNSKGTTG